MAAGQGRRFGSLKQFASLAGQPVLVHSVRAFEQCPQVAGYVVVAPPRRVGVVRRMLRNHDARKLLDVVPGGERRSDSVRAGLGALPDAGYVAIHDAARPLIHSRMLSLGLRACRKSKAATFGYPVTDTLKQVKGRTVVSTVDRRLLVAVQTPQFFSLALLRRAHEAARRSRRQATDDCEVVERVGVRPVWIPGPRTNLKLTTPEDMDVIRTLL